MKIVSISPQPLCHQMEISIWGIVFHSRILRQLHEECNSFRCIREDPDTIYLVLQLDTIVIFLGKAPEPLTASRRLRRSHILMLLQRSAEGIGGSLHLFA